MIRDDEEVFVLLPDGVRAGSFRPSTPSPAVESRPRPPTGAPAAPRAVPSRAPIALAAGFVAGALLIGVLAWGWTYYRLPLESRPLHPKHDGLRASGSIGLTLAISGTTLMLLNLGYLLRKWIPWLHRAGSLRAWMDFHVLTGLLGPAMVILHSGLLPTSIFGALGAGSMLVVVGAGIIGRYIYSRVPRSIAGHELEIEEVRRRLGELERRLARYGIGARLRRGPGENAGSPTASRGILGTLASLVAGDRRLRRRFRRERAAILSSPSAARHAAEVLPLLRRVASEEQWLVRYQELRSLMRSWRFLHRWLALLTMMFAAFHIGLALRYAKLWVLP